MHKGNVYGCFCLQIYYPKIMSRLAEHGSEFVDNNAYACHLKLALRIALFAL